MQALLAPLKELAEYDEIRKIVRQGKGTIALSGCVDSQKLMTEMSCCIRRRT